MFSKKATDPARFQGNGISYRAKLIGIEDIPEARGDKMCQEMIQKLKNGVKISGQHKQRVFVNVTLEGLRLYDAVSMSLLHTHPVHQISFISRDVTDSRAFGYIYGPGDGTHRFYGIKTANAAENLVLALRDLFQTVYEMKKKEVEVAKVKAAATQENQQSESPDTTYQVPPNGAPVEGQDNIYQGIEQIKNLEFDNLKEEEARQQPSPATTSPTISDPWGVSTAPGTTTAPASSLTDLQMLQAPAVSNPFSSMQAFPGTPHPSVGVMVSGPFAVPQAGVMPFMAPGQQPGSGLPVTKDPFGDDPFGSFSAQQRAPAPAPVPQTGMPFGQRPGFGNPFPVSMAGPVPGNPFPGAVVSPRAVPISQGFGMPGPGFAPFGLASPAVLGMGPMGSPQLQTQLADSNLLQPLKPGGQQQEEVPAPKSPRPPLFGDLVDIKRASDPSSVSKSPKEMFKDLKAPSKKSLNEIKVEGTAKPPASEAGKASDDLELPFAVDPFGPLDTVLDTASAGVDPFDTSHISSPSSPPPPLPPLSSLPLPPAPPDLSTHPTRKKSESEEQGGMASSKESSPEYRFDMPDEPPPPLPSHLQFSTSAPAPPPRPLPRDQVEPPVPQRPRPKPRRSTSASSSFSAVTSPVPTSSLPFPSFIQPPPLLSSPRPLPRAVSSPASSNTDISCVVPSTADASQLAQSDSRGASTNSSSSIIHAPPSPSHSLDSSLSHASSQKSLSDRTLNPTEEDDPFGVPLRSKKSSSADGARKSNRSSGGKSNLGSDPKLSVNKGSKSSLGIAPDLIGASDPKLAVMLDSKLAVSADPFGVPDPSVSVHSESPFSSDPFGVSLPDKNTSQDGGRELLSELDNPFSANAFGDVAASDGKWEAFGESQTNGVSEECDHFKEKTVGASSSIGDRPAASPFGDSFLSLSPVNGKLQEGQS